MKVDVQQEISDDIIANIDENREQGMKYDNQKTTSHFKGQYDLILKRFNTFIARRGYTCKFDDTNTMAYTIATKKRLLLKKKTKNNKDFFKYLIPLFIYKSIGSHIIRTQGSNIQE